MDVSTKRAVGTGLMSVWAWRVSKHWRRAQTDTNGLDEYASIQYGESGIICTGWKKKVRFGLKPPV